MGNKESISVNKKMIAAFAPVVAVLGVLIGRGDVGPMVLFLVGIAGGINIGVVYMKTKK